MSDDIILQASNITMLFPGTLALDRVDYRVWRGKVNVIIGENGAGKSTLMKILAGVQQPTSGELFLNGEKVVLSSTRAAAKLGIGMVHQELNLFENLSVAENIFLGRELQRGIRPINEAEQERRAAALMARLDQPISPKEPVGNLKVGQQQLVEIAKALAEDADILILDEPTSALSKTEVEILFRVIRELTRQGVTLIYISHRLEELMAIGDHITIFRDGRFISEREVRDASVPWIIEQMVGDKKKHFDYQAAAQGETVLEVDGLTALHQNGGYRLNEVSFSLRKGEVIGIYGLLGAGRTELFKGLIGLMHCQSGKVRLAGSALERCSFQQRLKRGITLVPEDRQGEGVVQLMSITANMTLTDLSLRGFRRALRLLHPAKEKRRVDEMIQHLAIKVSDPELPITSLSGGNQQKVVLGKALMTGPQVVLLDEPTRGIDVGAKTDVYHLIGTLAQQGLAVMFSSSELDEVMALADRVLVMADGRITADLPRAEVTREKLITASTPHD